MSKLQAAACAAAHWIVTRSFEWYRPSEAIEPLEEQVDIYYGSAGTILFFRELAESTGEHSYQKVALLGAGYTAGRLEQVKDSGLYCGLAGITWAIERIIGASKEAFLLRSLNRAIHRLQAQAKNDNAGVSWNESNDLFSGTAGIGLVLIHLAGQTAACRPRKNSPIPVAPQHRLTLFQYPGGCRSGIPDDISVAACFLTKSSQSGSPVS